MVDIYTIPNLQLGSSLTQMDAKFIFDERTITPERLDTAGWIHTAVELAKPW